MDFRTIIFFLIIASISSLFNKNKTSARPKVDTHKSAPPKSTPSGSDSNNKGTFSNSLEDLFKEIKTEFEKNLKGAPRNQTFSSMEQGVEKESNFITEQKIHPKENTPARDIKKIPGSIYKGEIGNEEIYIGFDKKSILGAVIMSEILQKPKGLER